MRILGSRTDMKPRINSDQRQHAVRILGSRTDMKPRINSGQRQDGADKSEIGSIDTKGMKSKI